VRVPSLPALPPGTAVAFPIQAPGAPGSADARIQNSK